MANAVHPVDNQESIQWVPDCITLLGDPLVNDIPWYICDSGTLCQNCYQVGPILSIAPTFSSPLTTIAPVSATAMEVSLHCIAIEDKGTLVKHERSFCHVFKQKFKIIWQASLR